MPSGVKNFFEDEFKVMNSIMNSTYEEVEKANDAARPKPGPFSLYASGALVALVAGLAVGM